MLYDADVNLKRPAEHSNRPALLAIALIVVAPAFLLWPFMLGQRTFVPYDLAIFPPVSTTLEPGELEAVRSGANYDVTEIPIWMVPEFKLARQALAEGRLPQWNPYARDGTVLLAHGLSGLLYPPNWLALARQDPADGLWMLAWINLVVAGLGTFALLRELRLGILAALFGALVFAFSGTLTANAHFYMRLASLVWLPAMAWAGLRMAHTVGIARVPAVICLALAVACTWVAGFPPYSAAATFLAAAWCLYLVGSVARKEGWHKATGLGLTLLVSGLLGLALAAAHLLPVFAFFPLSNRNPNPDLATIAPHALDWFVGLGYLMPNALGHPMEDSLPYAQSPLALYLGRGVNGATGEPLIPNYNFTEYSVYAGIPTLFFAFLGLQRLSARSRAFATGALVGIFILAIAPGPFLYLYQLPGLMAVPPMRWIGTAALVIAALAATGIDGLREALSKRTWMLLCTVAAALAAASGLAAMLCSSDPSLFERMDVVGAIADKFEALNPDLVDREYVRNVYLRGPGEQDYLIEGQNLLRANLLHACLASSATLLWLLLLPWIRRRGLLRPWLVVAVLATAIELGTLAAEVNRGRELPHSHDTQAHAFLRRELEQARGSGGFSVARADVQPSQPNQLPPGTLEPMGIRDLNTYRFFDDRSTRPLRALFETQYPGFLMRGYMPKAFPDTPLLQHPLFDLFGVRFWLSTVPLVHAGTRVGPQLAGPHGEFFIYERPSPPPRAFMVPTLRVLPNDERVIQALIADDFDPRAAALLTPDQSELLGQPGPGTDRIERSIRFAIDEPEEVELDIGPGPPGYLVLTDTHLPGWTATVNGVPSGLARANLFVRAIQIPFRDGCRVRFSYTTPGLHTGLAVSAASLLVLMALALVFALARSGRRLDLTRAPRVLKALIRNGRKPNLR